MPRAVFLGDSITGGLTLPPWTGIYYEVPWPTTAGALLGWEVHNLAVPGSGYTGGSGGALSLVVPAALALDPDIIVLSAGVNDVTASTGTYANVEAAVDELLESLAGVDQVYVTSPMPGQSGNGYLGIYGNAARRYVGAAIQRAALANGRPYIEMLDPEWIYGTGTKLAPIGDGNADQYVHGDAIHLNQDGEDFVGRLLARELARLWYANYTGIEAWITDPAGVHLAHLR